MLRETPYIVFANIPDSLHERIYSDLQHFFPNAEAHPKYLFSQSPPAWIEIVADVISWTTVFKAAAGVYLARLLQHLADDHWEQRHEIRQAVIEKYSDALDVLRKFFQNLSQAQDDLGQSLGILVKIPGPGTAKTGLRLSADDEAEFIENLSLFVERLPGIENAITTLDLGAAGDVFCKFEKDNFTLFWQDAKSLVPLRQTFNISGDSQGDPETYS